MQTTNKATYEKTFEELVRDCCAQIYAPDGSPERELELSRAAGDARALREAQDELLSLLDMSGAEVEEFGATEIQRLTDLQTAELERAADESVAIYRLREQVTAWEPPGGLVGLKSYVKTELTYDGYRGSRAASELQRLRELTPQDCWREAVERKEFRVRSYAAVVATHNTNERMRAVTLKALHEAFPPVADGVEFTVITTSSNANSFGLYQVLLLAENGEGWEILQSSLNKARQGDTIRRVGDLFLCGSYECPHPLESCKPSLALKVIAEAKAEGRKSNQTDTPS